MLHSGMLPMLDQLFPAIPFTGVAIRRSTSIGSQYRACRFLGTSCAHLPVADLP